MNLKEYFDHKNIKGNVQSFIAERTAQTLLAFCEQESEFAQAIEQSGKSFQDCLDYVIKGMVKIGNDGSLSDFDTYSRAAKFYFPGAVVHFRMEIDLIGNADGTVPEQKEPRTLSAVFDNLMDW
ncbi:MAG: hypothetical protein K2H29_08695 [Oscillospiraceae bacterium]|nr:hypothetical protein [Oscillospiraceae bacterium]